MSGGCGGLHCPGCGDGGGGGLVAALVVLVVIGAVLHAIWHTIVEVAEIAAWTVAGFAILAAAGGIGYLVIRTRQDRPGRPIAGRVVSQVPPEPRPELSRPYKPAIEPGRVQVWLTPEQLAAIITRSNNGEDR